MNVISDKRLLIKAKINNKNEVFLVDTGASIALIDKYYKGLKKGKRFNHSLIGAGGDIDASRICDTFIEIEGKLIGQFIMADISNVLDSIELETGFRPIGIISLPLMKFLGLKIDLLTNTVSI